MKIIYNVDKDTLSATQILRLHEESVKIIDESTNRILDDMRAAIHKIFEEVLEDMRKKMVVLRVEELYETKIPTTRAPDKR